MAPSRTNMACECAVCYSDAGPFRKLTCGHEFCNGCIKQWYMKGTGTGCPMCRRPIYFKGFHKIRDEWNEEHWRNKCFEIIDEYQTERIQEAFEIKGEFGPIWDAFISSELVSELKDLDRTARFLMSEGIDPDWLEAILYETDDYYSDRNVNKWLWYNDPPKPFETKYPKMAASGAKGTRRARAPADPYVTFVFLIQI